MPQKVAWTIGPQGCGAVVSDAQLLIKVAVVGAAVVVVVAASMITATMCMFSVGVGTVTAKPFPERGEERTYIRDLLYTFEVRASQG